MSAEETSVDVLVVGAGPAGTAAAITLANSGRSVLVVDAATFPRDKCCGDGLTALALRELEHLGLDPAHVQNWQPCLDVVVVSPSGRQVVLELPRGRGWFAVTAPRLHLDAALLDVARAAGATVRDGAALTAVATEFNRIRATIYGLGTVDASFLVAADGMWSPTRKAAGDRWEPGYRGEWHAYRQYARDVSGPAASAMYVWFEPDLVPGYAWSFPLPGGRANVGFGIHRGERVSVAEMGDLWPSLLDRTHIRAALGVTAVLENRPTAWPIPARVDVALRHGCLVGRERRILYVGDAAAVVDPMSGEGIGQALVTGRVAAEAIIGGGSAVSVGERYARAVRDELLADHRMSRLLVRALRHRRGARAAVRAAGTSEWTRRKFARWLFEDEPRAVVATPRRWHRRFLDRDGAYVGWV